MTEAPTFNEANWLKEIIEGTTLGDTFYEIDNFISAYPDRSSDVDTSVLKPVYDRELAELVLLRFEPTLEAWITQIELLVALKMEESGYNLLSAQLAIVHSILEGTMYSEDADVLQAFFEENTQSEAAESSETHLLPADLISRIKMALEKAQAIEALLAEVETSVSLSSDEALTERVRRKLYGPYWFMVK